MLLRIINTIVILLMIDLFGLLPESSIVKVVIDFFIAGLTFYIVIRMKKGPDQTERFIRNLFLFFGGVALLTYLRGGSSMLDIYKFARIYFPLLLIFPLMYDINYTEDGFRYYRKLFQVIAVCVTIMLILISVFHVEFFSSWPRLTSDNQYDDYIPGLKRVYIYSSFTFPIVEFIFLVYSLFLGLRVNKALFALITVGFLLQGFRSYILATFLIVTLSIIFYLNKQQGFSLFRFLRKNLLVISGAFTMGVIFLGNRIASGVSDFVNVSGTFGSRIMLDAFRLKVFAENYLFGVGFLHNDASKAKQMGVTSSEELRAAMNETNYDVLQNSAIYSLRATDSGYLDILVQFGIAGVLIFLAIYLFFYIQIGNALSSSTKADVKVYVLTLRAVLLLFLLTLVTHAGMTNIYGLLPIAMALSFAQCMINRGKVMTV